MTDHQHFYIGSDKDSQAFKNLVKEALDAASINYTDLGTFGGEASEHDYADIAREVSEKVYENHAIGALFSSYAIGQCMLANGRKGIRAALCHTVTSAERARAHHNANVLCIDVDDISADVAIQIVKMFLQTKFDQAQYEHIVRKYEEHE